MKTFLFFSFLLISAPLFAVEKIWTGGVNNNWATAGNWSPSGAPGANDDVYIDAPGHPQISGGAVTIQSLGLYGTLSVWTGATLTVTGANNPVYVFFLIGSGELRNEGTISVGYAGYNSVAFFLGNTSSITNSGTINMYGTEARGLTFATGYSGASLNNASGVINSECYIGLTWFANASGAMTNLGTINTFGNWGIATSSTNPGVSFINRGTVNSNDIFGISNEGSVDNQACGIINVSNGRYLNPGTTTNAGLILIKNELVNNGSFTNNRVISYAARSGTGTFTNTHNNAIIVNHNNPEIFTYGGNFLGGIAIYKDADLLVSAGSFTKPNNFTPDGLAVGTHTLYARITPPGTNNCPYTVPFSYTVTVLPVKLVAFDVALERNSAHLSWSTTAETNSSHFEVERSRDVKNWERIGSVIAGGESSTLRTYGYTDARVLPGSNYYRLKMVDTDGTFAYSRIEAVSFESHEVAIYGYPNPFRDKLLIRSQHFQSARVIEVTGRPLRTLELKPGENEVSTTHWQPGLYLIRLNEGTVIRVLKK